MGLALPTLTAHTARIGLDATDSLVDRGRGRLFVVLPVAAVLGCLLVLSSPVLVRLFGVERSRAAGGPAEDLVAGRLGLAAATVALRMDELRSDLAVIGAANSVARLLAGADATSRLAVSHDLESFLVAKAWCRRISLTREDVALVTAARRIEGSGCGRLVRLSNGLSPGFFLVDSARAGDRVSLCLAVTLAAPDRSTAIVAEADPLLAFATLRLFSPADADGLFLRDGGGSWLIAPPDEAGLVSSTAAVASWQGPSGGRWEVAAVTAAR